MRKIFLLICFLMPIACNARILHVGELEFKTFPTKLTEHAIVMRRETGVLEYVPIFRKWYNGTLHVNMDGVVYSACKTNFHQEGHYFFCGDDLVAVDDTICAHDFYYDGDYYFCGNNLIGADDNVYLKIQNDSVNGYSNEILTKITWANADRLNFTVGYRQTEPTPTNYTDNIMFFATHGENKSYISYAGSFYGYNVIMTNIEPNITCAEFMELPKQTFDIQYTSTGDIAIRFGSWSDNYWSRTMNWYRVKMYGGNTLLADFVPVPAGMQIGNFTVPSNGMWDIVEQKFYGNSGTGEFIYGVDE